MTPRPLRAQLPAENSRHAMLAKMTGGGVAGPFAEGDTEPALGGGPW